jgi:hypothetical protein
LTIPAKSLIIRVILIITSLLYTYLFVACVFHYSTFRGNAYFILVLRKDREILHYVEKYLQL